MNGRIETSCRFGEFLDALRTIVGSEVSRVVGAGLN